MSDIGIRLQLSSAQREALRDEWNEFFQRKPWPANSYWPARSSGAIAGAIDVELKAVFDWESDQDTGAMGDG